MTDLQLSYLRSLAKFVGGVLVAKGALDAADVVTLTAVLEGLVGAAIGIYGVWQSHRKHA